MVRKNQRDQRARPDAAAAAQPLGAKFGHAVARQFGRRRDLDGRQQHRPDARHQHADRRNPASHAEDKHEDRQRQHRPNAATAACGSPASMVIASATANSGNRLAPAHHAQPRQRQPGGRAHRAHVLRLRREKAAQFVDRAADPGRARPRAQAPQESIGSDTRDPDLRHFRNGQQPRHQIRPQPRARQRRRECRRVKQRGLDVGVDGIPAVGVRVPQRQLAAPE